MQFLPYVYFASFLDLLTSNKGHRNLICATLSFGVFYFNTQASLPHSYLLRCDVMFYVSAFYNMFAEMCFSFAICFVIRL
jgi:hypothetical protein